MTIDDMLHFMITTSCNKITRRLVAIISVVLCMEPLQRRLIAVVINCSYCKFPVVKNCQRCQYWKLRRTIPAQKNMNENVVSRNKEKISTKFPSMNGNEDVDSK